ncbi:MAG: hypothetical protein ABSG69_19550 [Candidatus Acidiferrum sp.]|jgi:hypothetical protein
MALLVAAIILFFGGKQWVETRTLRPLNIPISLDRGSISSTVTLNVHAAYSISIVRTEPGNLDCHGVALTTRRLSSIGGLKVYQRPDEQTDPAQDVTLGDFLGSFEGQPGRYNLAIDVLSDTACLNSLRPRLTIVASSADFRLWTEHYESWCAASILVGFLGVILIITSGYASLRRRSDATSNPSILGQQPTP